MQPPLGCQGPCADLSALSGSYGTGILQPRLPPLHILISKTHNLASLEELTFSATLQGLWFSLLSLPSFPTSQPLSLSSTDIQGVKVNAFFYRIVSCGHHPPSPSILALALVHSQRSCAHMSAVGFVMVSWGLHRSQSLAQFSQLLRGRVRAGGEAPQLHITHQNSGGTTHQNTGTQV